MLLPWLAMAQYNPANPPQPNYPDGEDPYRHHVYVERIPNNSSFRITGEGTYLEGDEVTLTATGTTESPFKAWVDVNGKTVSTSDTYKFTMGNSDVKYFATFAYSPSSPANPVYTPSYPVEFSWKPLTGATSSYTTKRFEVGSKVNISYSLNPGFKIAGVEETLPDGTVMYYPKDSESFFLSGFMMPDHTVRMCLVLDYDPVSPPDLTTNYWDESTGTLIMNDYETGMLYNKIASIVSNITLVRNLTVKGKINAEDIKKLGKMELDVLDLHQADIRQSWIFSSVPGDPVLLDFIATKLLLPPYIGQMEWGTTSSKGAVSLGKFTGTDLYLYGSAIMEFPLMNDGIYYYTEQIMNPSTVTVYVPQDMIEAYKAHSEWSKFMILPIIDDADVKVNLPAECADGRYKNMVLDLVDNTTGRHNRYIINDKLSYTYYKLTAGHKYVVYLKSSNGKILGEISEFVLDKETTVSFDISELKELQTINIIVRDKDGNDVTSKTTLTWRDAEAKENIIGTGSSLSGQAPGSKVLCSIALAEELARKYEIPEDLTIEVKKMTGNTFTMAVDLNELPTFWCLVDAKLNDNPGDHSVSTVTITSTANGYQNSVSHSNVFELGAWTPIGDLSITVSCENYITKTITLTKDELLEQLKDIADKPGKKYLFNEVTLEAISGVIGKLSYTYHKSVIDDGTVTGTSSETTEAFSDYNNVSYTIFNETKGTVVDKFSAQYPQLIMMEGVDKGDVVTVTAKSTKGTFNDAKCQATVQADNSVNLNFDIYENGGLWARFLVTDNTSVYAFLYDEAGNYVADQKYRTNFTLYETELGDVMRHDNQPNYVFFQNLPDGKYTLYTVGSTPMYDTSAKLKSLIASKELGADEYVKNDITIEHGKIVAQRNVKIPVFNESRFYLTKDYSFTVNKPTVTAGSYLTIKLDARFNNGKPGDVDYIVNLPKNVTVVEGSVLMGNKQVAYEFKDNQLIVPTPEKENFTQLKFCVVTSERGNYSPDAFIRYGATTQPIGSLNYTVTDLTIFAPAIISTPELHVDGNAPGNSEIKIYDGEKMIGQTKAIADGYWSADLNLSVQENLAFHEIWAEVTTQAGVKVNTERRLVEYNDGAIQAKSVLMSLYNDAGRGQVIKVNFDLERYKASVRNYAFEPGVDIVFTADLTNNDPSVINSATLRVYTINHDWLELPMKYIENLDRWVASGRFDGNTAPMGVRVSVDSKFSDRIPSLTAGQMRTNSFAAMEGTFHRVFNINVDDEPKPGVAIVDEFVIPTEGYALLTNGLYQNVANYYKEYPEFADQSFRVDEKGKYYIKYMNGDKVTVYDFEDGASVRPRRAGAIATDQVTALRNQIAALNATATEINNAITDVQQFIESSADKSKLNDVKGLYTYLRTLNSVIGWAKDGIKDVNAWQAFNDGILPCKGADDAEARALWALCEDLKARHGRRYLMSCDLAEISLNLVKYMLEDKDGGLPHLTGDNIALLNRLTNSAAELYKVNRIQSRNHIRKAKRDRNKFKNCGYDKLEELDDNWFVDVPYPIVEPVIDPQGYVYEGVSTNRLEGVTATAYYKNSYEDIYGDLQEEIVLWDATQYGQRNPLYTDENGMYQWDVPQGLWQVKFEKEGYQTTYTDWLPVPPPQMDVNVAMVQATQPSVIKARAFEAGSTVDGGVEITFDKYMQLASLSTDNVIVAGVKGGEETVLTDVVISYPDKEQINEENPTAYATKAFVKNNDLNLYDEVKITVAKTVKSYAGISMSDDFSQRVYIERRIASIAADSVANIGFGLGTTLRVAALPTEASAGRKIIITSADSITASLTADSLSTVTLTLDENGQAEFLVNGSLYGKTALRYEVVDEDVTGRTIVNVVDPALLADVENVAASRMSGTAVYRGQVVTLECPTEGATIYYTTDGSCPCEEATRKEYTGPIAITDAMTLKTMAVGITGKESEISEYVYTIRKSNLALTLAEGWNWASHDLMDAVALSQFTSLVATVVTADAAAAEIASADAVKLQATNNTTVIAFQGDQVNPATTEITLNPGWNWIGYPVDQMLTLNDALRYLPAEEGDIITNLEGGFAEYTDGKWSGTLEVMVPGQGYIYKPQSQKVFSYNNVATENAQTYLGRYSAAANAEFTVDQHKYANVMPVTVSVAVNTKVQNSSAYTVGAFCNGECRGVSQNVDGRLVISVYGNPGDKIDFAIKSNRANVTLTPANTVTFADTAVGSAKAPYELSAKLRGDANMDGEVSVADLTCIASYILTQETSDINTEIADYNGDGTISVADLTQLAATILGF